MSRPVVLDGVEPGNSRVVLVVTAHADDAALFIGGTVAAWSAAGWRVVLARVTDDRWDSVGLDEATTIERSARELRSAADALGVAEVVDLGWPTDTLGDASEVALREQVIRLVRTHRPHTIVAHDPHSGVGEDNLDHLVVGAAVAEAVWCAQFDLHHPEHLAEGLEVHGVFEQWYFGRPPGEVTHVVDTSSTMDAMVAAAAAHRTPLRNLVQQWRLQARTGGWRIPLLDGVAEAGPDDDLTDLVDPLLRSRAASTGAPHGLDAAEEFRVVTFGGMTELLEVFGERI
ncbi:MAG: PIG-L family deacetylase [Acidobacteria bacterium]|nr:PIG-L family deacetylase [Acidobacteriota bacterium]